MTDTKLSRDAARTFAIAFTSKALVQMANMLSADMDKTAPNLAPDYHEGVRAMFLGLCDELEQRGLVLSDHVMCPETL